MRITKNISVHETLFTELKNRHRVSWWQFELLPIISLEHNRVLIGWLNLTIDIHRSFYLNEK